jgi:hypothetical protein
MPSFLNQELTDAGWDALSQSLAGGKMTFFKMQAGDGTIVNDNEIPPLTALKNPITDIALTVYHFEGEGQITLQGNLNSKDLDLGFTFRELGVFVTIEEPDPGRGGGSPLGVSVIEATVPTPQANPIVPAPNPGTVVMYSYCNNYALSDYVPGKGESTDVVNTIQVVVKIDRNANMSVSIVAGEQLSVTNIGAPSVGAGPWSYTQANVAYLKRLVPGPEILIEENADTITIGKKELKTWMYLYVAHGNPDVAPHFSTLPNAYQYLQQYAIPNNLGAVIFMSRGIWDIADTIYLYHTDGQRIYIYGEDLPAQSFNSMWISAGGQWNYYVTLGGLTDTSNFVVGNMALIYGVSGSNGWGSALLPGIFPITAKTANSITVWIRCKLGSWPDMTGFYWGGVWPINTIFRVPFNRPGFVVGPSGLGQFRSCAIKASTYPTQSCWGILSIGPINLYKFGVYGFNPGAAGECVHAIYVSGSGAQAYLDMCACSDNHSGFVCAGGASMNIYHGASSHNSLRGIWCEGAYVGGAATYLWLAGNQNEGIISSGSNVGFIKDYRLGPSAIFSMFNRTGMTAYGNARSIINADGSYIAALGNQDYDIEAELIAFTSWQGNCYGTRRYNHPIGQPSIYMGVNL